MLELAERIIRLTGSKSEIVFNPLPSDDPKQRKPDISLATRGSAAGALPSNSNGACKRRSSISSRSSVIDSACDRDSFRPPLYTNGTCRKCDKVGGRERLSSVFPEPFRHPIRLWLVQTIRVRPGPYIRDPAALFIPCRHACDRFQIEKRHRRSHRKRNTWANTADSVLRIVQHGSCKDNPACRAFSWQYAFARSEFGSSAPAARMNHSLQKSGSPNAWESHRTGLHKAFFISAVYICMYTPAVERIGDTGISADMTLAVGHEERLVGSVTYTFQKHTALFERTVRSHPIPLRESRHQRICS